MHIWSPNPLVRDKGVYFLISEAIGRQIISTEQLEMGFHYFLADSVLFDHITEPFNDGIYKRAYAPLILALFLGEDRSGESFISAKMLDKSLVQIATYLAFEKDTRGFIGTNGWAHAYSHIGNVLEELTLRTDISRADKICLLTILVEQIKRLESPLIFGETSRLANYIVNLTGKNEIYKTYFLTQLKNWRKELIDIHQLETEGLYTRFFNRQRLVQALLLHDGLDKEIADYLTSNNGYII